MPAKRKDFDQGVVLYNSGFSIQQVADYYGISRQSMYASLKRRGVVFRSHLRLGKDNHFYRGTKRPDRIGQVVTLAREKGIIKPHPCEVCGYFGYASDGRLLVHAHHDDYNFPLDVRWLCKKHHHKWHCENQAICLRGEIPAMSRQEVCSLGGSAKRRKKGTVSK